MKNIVRPLFLYKTKETFRTTLYIEVVEFRWKILRQIISQCIGKTDFRHKKEIVVFRNYKCSIENVTKE